MKSKLNFLVLAVLVLSAYCCSSKGDNTVLEVNVGEHKMFVFSYSALNSNVATVPLSSLVESLELVQLETKDEAYFKLWFTTVTDKYIGVRQHDGPYLLFDRSGKFLGNVGSIGRGPGEYSIVPYDDIIDDKNELIYLAPFVGNKILVYNTSGQFVKDIAAPQHLNKAKIFLSDGILTAVHFPFPNDKAIAIQFDANTGEVLKDLAPPAHLISVSNDFGRIEIFNTRSAPGIFDLLFTGNDTLYHFDVRNNKMLPFFMLKHNTSENPWKQYFQVNKDLIMTWTSGKLQATDMKNKTSSNIKIVNDFLGNMPVPMTIVQIRDGYWVHNVQPEELIENIENRLAERGLSDADKQALDKTLAALKVGTNNVVFIGKLKDGVKTKLW